MGREIAKIFFSPRFEFQVAVMPGFEPSRCRILLGKLSLQFVRIFLDFANPNASIDVDMNGVEQEMSSYLNRTLSVTLLENREN